VKAKTKQVMTVRNLPPKRENTCTWLLNHRAADYFRVYYAP